MSEMRETPSQTAGPYVHIGLAPAAAGLGATVAAFGASVFPPGEPGEPLCIEGILRDGAGAPVTDALIEVRQADAAGRVRPDAGWGRVVPDFETGLWSFDTVKPGAVGGAPHIALWIVARGINLGLHTRLYLEDEASNATDPLLRRAGPRAPTLVARRIGPGLYRHEIRLQGEGETVFLDL